MKKLTLHVILFISFTVFFLTVLFFSVSELVYIYNYTKTDAEIQSIFTQEKLIEELNFVFETDVNLTQILMITEKKTELNNLQKKHQENSTKFNKNKDRLRLLLSGVNADPGNLKLLRIIEDASKLYNKEIDPLILSLIKQKEKLTEIQNDFPKSINSKDFNILYANIHEESNQINETSEIVSDNLITAKNIIKKKASVLSEQKNNLLRNAELSLLIFVIIVFILLALIYAYISKYIFQPTAKIQNFVDILAAGALPEEEHFIAGKDIINISSSLNKVVANLKKAVIFSEELGKGNFSSEFKPAGDKDSLGNTLLSLKENLQKSKTEEDKRKTEETQRQKTNEGLTMFAEILRRHSDNLQELADKVISALVNFTGANQGALFFLNDENSENIFYELIGAYAYNRKKYLSKEIKPGEGLIGAVALEKYTVYMTEVPEDYIEIESGTGKANPKSILIVPLKIEDKVLGVIELASFNKFNKEEIKTVEKIAESIAGSLSSAKINMQTTKLNAQFRERVELLQQTEKELEKSLSEIKNLTRKITRLERENNRLQNILET
ncbi:MAG: GAF domain-containing protein [Bacteroidales bacterium]|nr:GAF domain-containing protein [Bacteroidales bacterium]